MDTTNATDTNGMMSGLIFPWPSASQKIDALASLDQHLYQTLKAKVCAGCGSTSELTKVHASLLPGSYYICEKCS